MEKKEYISVKTFADKYEISERTARNYCANGKINGAFLVGKTWNIPTDASKDWFAVGNYKRFQRVSGRYLSQRTG